MDAVFWAWGISAAVLLLLAVLLGAVVIGKSPLGILIDQRGRYSLTHFQLCAWTIVVLSLVSGVFWGRVFHDAAGALDFTIPNELLVVLGISVGSGVLATTIKSVKDNNPATAANVAASNATDPPHFWQIFLVEEGALADQIIDITKFQNFVITIILLVAYVALAIGTLGKFNSPDQITTLPGFSTQFVTLLGISHGGYIVGKIPNPAGPAPGLTVAGRRAGHVPRAAGAAPLPNTYLPRRP